MQTRDQCTFFLLFVRWSKTGREKMCKQGKNVQTRTKSGDSRPPKKETDKIKKHPQEFVQGQPSARQVRNGVGQPCRNTAVDAQPELETHLKYCFQSSKGLVQVRVPLFWFGPLGLGSGFVRERVPVQVRLRTKTPRGGGLCAINFKFWLSSLAGAVVLVVLVLHKPGMQDKRRRLHRPERRT